MLTQRIYSIEVYSKFSLALLLAVAIAVVCGCSRDTSPVVAEVDGHVLRKSEVDARATNIAALFLHRTGELDRLERIKAQFRSGYAKIWVEDRVLEDAAKAAGLEIPQEIVEKCREGAFRNFKTKSDKSYDDLMNIPGFSRELWEDQVVSEARRIAMNSYWLKSEPANLPADYADKVLADLAKWHENMAKTNALQYAKATNVWEKLNAGADFVKTARINTEKTDEIEDNCEWGTIDDKFLADEPVLLGLLKKMKIGEYTPPVDADGGILIVRLDALDKDEGYTVSRIFFRKGNILRPASRTAIEADGKKKYAERLFQRKLGELVKKAKVTISSAGNAEKHDIERKKTK